MNQRIKDALIAVAAITSAVMFVGITRAAEVQDGAPIRAVAYSDLNSNSEAGVQVLYKRIQGAANQVCGNLEVRDLPAVRARKACVDRAVSDAVAAVNTSSAE